MKRLFLVLILSVAASGLWAGGWSGAEIWKDADNKATECHGFSIGYIDTVMDKFPWTPEDIKAWAVVLLMTDADKLVKEVDAFYRDPANRDVTTAKAMRICLERQIAKTPDGPRLLAIIGVRVDQVASR